MENVHNTRSVFKRDASVCLHSHVDFDDVNVTVRLGRHPNGATSLALVRGAGPWVIRRQYLVPEDLD